MKRFASIFTALAVASTLMTSVMPTAGFAAYEATFEGEIAAASTPDAKTALTAKTVDGPAKLDDTSETCEHDWQEEGEIPANCTDCRQVIMRCSLCRKEEYVADESVKALGHIETAKITLRQPTCTSYGVEYYVCDRCGRAVDSQIDMLPHNYVETSQRIPSTCVEPEYIVMECSSCYAIEKIPITSSALKDHSFDENGVCTVCGTYRVSNEDELFRFAEAVNSGNVNINALMTDNVVCTRDWTPIGTYKYRYMGTFNGQGHTISGVHINAPNEGNIGLFAYVGSDGSVLQTGVIDSSITGKNEVGGIAGRNSGKVSNCFTIVELNGSDYIGGICGTNYGTIENCYSLVKMEKKQSRGGVCGSETYTSKIINCYYNSDIYRYSNGIGTGVSTFTMISENAVSLMKLDEKIWAVKPSDSTTLYFPGFKSTSSFPTFAYDAKLTIGFAGTELALTSDELKFNIDAEIKLGETFDYFSVITNDELDDLELYADNKKLAADMALGMDDTDGAVATVTDKLTHGEHTFTARFTGNDLFTGLTAEKKLTLKSVLSASDFVFTAPASPLEYNGAAHYASVVPAAGNTNVGGITVKYFDKNDNEVRQPVFPGVYTVKITVEESGIHPAALGLTDKDWTFTITKADRSIPDIEQPYIWTEQGLKSVEIKGLPDDTGDMEEPVISVDDVNSIIVPNTAAFSNGVVSFKLSAADKSAAGKSARITVTLVTQNYKDMTFTITVLLTDKQPQGAPECVLSVKPSGAEYFDVVIEPVTGAEYRFFDNNWSSDNVLTDVAHDTEVTAYIRMAETSLLSPSKTISGTVRTGHGALAHHEAVSSTCAKNGNIEYWSCDICHRYFGDPDAKNELSSETVLLPKPEHIWSTEYRKNSSGHWHTCKNCNGSSDVQPHISSGPATYYSPEVCKVCGYEISPKKAGGGSSGSSGSGSGSSAEREASLPSMNGTAMSWDDIAATLEKLAAGSSAVIELSGNTDVPEKIFKIASQNRLTVEFALDSVKSWVVDGAKLTAVSGANLSILPGNADKSALRGTLGADMKVSGTNVAAGLKLNFRKGFAGYFANLYKSVNGELQFQKCAAVGEDGSVILYDADQAGEYVVMVCQFSDLPGDMNNDGMLNALDAAAVLKYVIGMETAGNIEVSDLNGDKTINALDASAILKMAVGL